MAAEELTDSMNIVETDDELSTEVASMYSGTVDELAELVEDEVEHEAAVRVICRLKCAQDPVDEQCAELEVGVELQVEDNQS